MLKRSIWKSFFKDYNFSFDQSLKNAQVVINTSLNEDISPWFMTLKFLPTLSASLLNRFLNENQDNYIIQPEFIIFQR